MSYKPIFLIFFEQKVNSDGTYEEFSQADAKNPVNKKLNRWSNVLPYDHSRIILEHEVTDYINASLVKVTYCHL